MRTALINGEGKDKKSCPIIKSPELKLIRKKQIFSMTRIV